MSTSMTIDLPDVVATATFGRRLGPLLFPGAVVGLVGPLGAGKTHLVRAIAEGLDIADSRIVTSPTFVLIQEYEARLPIYHFDAYRLADEREFLDLGVTEYFHGQGVCMVEWADKVESCLPGARLEIKLTITGETTRRVQVTARGTPYETMVRVLQAR